MIVEIINEDGKSHVELCICEFQGTNFAVYHDIEYHN